MLLALIYLSARSRTDDNALTYLIFWQTDAHRSSVCSLVGDSILQEFYSATLTAHVTLGAVAVLAGFLAIIARKGSPPHIGAGRIFVFAMGLSSALGAVLGLYKADTLYITFHAGVLGVTLVASGWLTAAARSRPLGVATGLLGAVNAVNAAGLIAVGLYAQGQAEGEFLGYPAEDYFFLSGMAIIGVIGDTSLLFRKTLSDKHRIARHLWRLCLGFFIAAGSAFTGPGASAFPQSVRDTGVLVLPELLIFLTLVFWIIRTLWKGSPAPNEAA